MNSAGTLIPAGLFAQLRFDLEFMLVCALLIVLIVAGGIAVFKVRSWRHEDAAPISLEDQIAEYQALVERGDLDPREFERLKASLQQKAAEPPPPA